MSDSTGVGTMIAIDGDGVGVVSGRGPAEDDMPLTWAGRDSVREWLWRRGQMWGEMSSVVVSRGQHRVLVVLPGGDSIAQVAQFTEYNNMKVAGKRRRAVLECTGNP